MMIRRLEAPRCITGESPVWDPARGRLYYIDNVGMKVHAYDPASGKTNSLETPEVITGMVLRQCGGAVVTLVRGIHLLDLETGALELVHALPTPPSYIFNDGKVDPRGRFVIGASTANFTAAEATGGLFRLDADRRLTQLDDGISVSNGPCWSPDGKTLYFSDSAIDTIYAYDYDAETGEAAGRRPLVNTGELGGSPDGATVDADGLLWVAIFRAGKVAAFRPDGGLERTVDLPVKLVTSVAFGGPDLDRLYVTSFSRDLAAEMQGAAEAIENAEAGGLFVIEGLGVRGRPEFSFAG
jgi:sugar lactone lactonase YvrE